MCYNLIYCSPVILFLMPCISLAQSTVITEDVNSQHVEGLSWTM